MGVYLAGAVLVVLKSILRVPALQDAVPGTGSGVVKKVHSAGTAIKEADE